jgi:hypothetical protein
VRITEIVGFVIERHFETFWRICLSDKNRIAYQKADSVLSGQLDISSLQQGFGFVFDGSALRLRSTGATLERQYHRG